MSDSKEKIPRRQFVKTTAYVTAAVSALPSVVSGCKTEESNKEKQKSFVFDNKKREFPKGKLNIAVIGLGMGYSNLKNCTDENIVAMCDVDQQILGHKMQMYKKQFPDKTEPYAYQNYKKMFEEIGDQIDAVIIATPDHSHANITLDAMKLGKHVYTQKPLTHNVYESRILTEAAKKYPNVVTQMGNQGASADTTAWACEAIWDGAIGDITEVHAWTNRPIWPQALNRPKNNPPVPEGLDWDMWLGPAPDRPYNPIYHPWNWRGWWAFGTGALGDMACHILDVIVRALKLEYPYGVQASSSRWTIESPAESQMITYYFPEREPYGKIKMPKVKLHWYDGGIMPPKPEEMLDDEKMGDKNGGVIFVGTKGKLVTGTYAQHPQLIPSSEYKGYKPPQTERRIPYGAGGHEKDWIRQCKTAPDKREITKSDFRFAGPFNEVVVMGTVAARLKGLNRLLRWDGHNMKFTNIKPDEEIIIPKSVKFDKTQAIPRYVTEKVRVKALDYAQHLIKRTRRPGWELEI
ncbi:MAG: Gfo/Idh/MocA family oxidoreductase [Chlorobi bacterium]|nr:Gfo/Idh/MocA family oxidoreductase [Chlorobiota bacterium]